MDVCGSCQDAHGRATRFLVCLLPAASPACSVDAIRKIGFESLRHDATILPPEKGATAPSSWLISRNALMDRFPTLIDGVLLAQAKVFMGIPSSTSEPLPLTSMTPGLVSP